MKYVYINPECLIENNIFTTGECKQKKIINPLGGKKQHKHISTKDCRFYRFNCEEGLGIRNEHYLSIRDAVLIPQAFTMDRVLSQNDKLKLNELKTNIKVLKDKMDYCSARNLIKQEEVMKKAFDEFVNNLNDENNMEIALEIESGFRRCFNRCNLTIENQHRL
ncbi:MAG: hypothetical protein LBD63_03000 [Mycoplasmataceae bacterium]|jgi:hypothetical protein|nr:hypothetical protein [Mycoplasmataceae bacterium]